MVKLLSLVVVGDLRTSVTVRNRVSNKNFSRVGPWKTIFIVTIAIQLRLSLDKSCSYNCKNSKIIVCESCS